MVKWNCRQNQQKSGFCAFQLKYNGKYFGLNMLLQLHIYLKFSDAIQPRVSSRISLIVFFLPDDVYAANMQ